MRWVIGIDEAGRGPLAGPISVGAVAIPIAENEWRHWSGLKDSKQLTPLVRDEWFTAIQERGVRHAVHMVSSRVIDAAGIVRAAEMATRRAIDSLALLPHECEVLLDWGLKAPFSYRQEWLVKGDENVPAIALASIMAKVTRDRHMIRLAHTYPAYAFEQHKGYGTALHRECLELHGPCPIHRRSFLRT